MDLNTVGYVTSAPFFWLSMGATAAIAIFVGAIIYDGDLSNAAKGLLSIFLYAGMILSVDYVRINNLFTKFPNKIDYTRYAGIVSIGIVTVFWILGIILGVLASHLVRRRNKKVV